MRYRRLAHIWGDFCMRSSVIISIRHRDGRIGVPAKPSEHFHGRMTVFSSITVVAVSREDCWAGVPSAFSCNK